MGDSTFEYTDKMIVCEDCGEEFVHSAEDQARYAERGFTNEPKRCRTCREKRKERQTQSRPQRGPSRGGGYGPPRGGSSGGGPRRAGPPRGDRVSYPAVCAACGASTTVPFKPTGDRPVYCRDCYRSLRR